MSVIMNSDVASGNRSATRASSTFGPLTLTALGHGILVWLDRYRARNALRKMDYSRLKDIGLTRTEALKEARKPIWRA